MKILHVVSSMNSRCGGLAEVVPRLAEEQFRLGHEVAIVCLCFDLSQAAQRAARAGVKIVQFDDKGCGEIGFSRDFNANVESLIKDADVVHLHGMWQWPCWKAGWTAQKLHKPYVMMPHGFLEPERLKISKWKKMLVGALIEKPLLRRSAGVVATAESEAVGIRDYGVDKRIHVMPIGLDLDDFKLSNCAGRTLLYFSRITPIKGLDMLADVWGRIDRKGWKLLMVGPDDRGYTETVKSIFAAKCPADSFEFRGPVFGAEKYALLSSADAFILPTRSENWGIAVAEAMACGLPVICTKGAPWGCLNKVQAGWWVDVGIEGIMKGVESMISLSAEARKEMGLRGRAWVIENLNWRTIAQNILSFYNSL